MPPELDGVIAAPDSHRVLLEIPAARVLEVVIEPGSREPERTHRNRSVMIVDAPAWIRYYENGDLTFESPPGPARSRLPSPEWIPRGRTPSRTSTPPAITPSASSSLTEERPTSTLTGSV